MDKDVVLFVESEIIEEKGKPLNEKLENRKETDAKIDVDVSYDENTRYYWF